jgi:hypothetical protein
MGTPCCQRLGIVFDKSVTDLYASKYRKGDGVLFMGVSCATAEAHDLLLRFFCY